MTPSRTRTHERHAYTLMELVVALAVSTLLLGALGSAVVVAANALPGEDGGATQSMLDTAGALERVASDLEQAVYLPDGGARRVAVVLPDADGDGAPELREYAWGGSAGDPLTLTEDGGDAENVLEDVDSFALDFDGVTRDETYPGAIITNSGEVASFPAVTSKSSTITLDKGKAFGQKITPTLPAGVAQWRATSVELYMRTDGIIPLLESGQIAMQLRPMSGSVPGTTILAEATQTESALKTTYSWVTFEWASPPTLDANTSYFLVFGNTTSDSSAGRVTSEKDAGVGLYDGSANAGFWSDGGSDPSWSERGGEEVLFRLHGEYETQNPDIGVTRHFVTRFTIGLTSGGDAPTTLTSSVRALNSPEALASFWDADFASDPTGLDLNADGVADWARADAGAFDTTTLGAGVWKADTEIDALPRTDLTRPTYVDLRWRCTSPSETGVWFFIACDQAGGNQAVLSLWLRAHDANTQGLTLSYVNTSGGLTTLVDHAISSGDMIDTRLVIDPDSDSAVLIVNGAEVGTYAYHTRAYSTSEHKTRIVPAGSGVEIDRVRVRTVTP
ncbi:MAG: choice-of-anchor R domain-containing protein [Phycisphaerales bacterium]